MLFSCNPFLSNMMGFLEANSWLSWEGIYNWLELTPDFSLRKWSKKELWYHEHITISSFAHNFMFSLCQPRSEPWHYTSGVLSHHKQLPSSETPYRLQYFSGIKWVTPLQWDQYLRSLKGQRRALNQMPWKLQIYQAWQSNPLILLIASTSTT